MSSSGSHRIPASGKPSTRGVEPSAGTATPVAAQRRPVAPSNKLKDFLLTVVVLGLLLIMTVSVLCFVSILSTGTVAFGYSFEELPYAAEQFGTQLFHELVPSEWIPKIGREGRGFTKNGKSVGDLDYRRLRTIDEKVLAQFDGRHKGQLILLSITGLVFNVSSGATHYAKGGGYNFLAGKDASISFVTGCFDETCFESQATGWDAVNDDGARTINDWLISYKEKYPLYAKLDKVYEQYHTNHPLHRHAKFETPIELHRERAQQAKSNPDATPFKSAKLPKTEVLYK